MKIVNLDACTTNPGDLSWSFLSKYSDDVKIYDRTQPEDVVSRAKGAEILVINKTIITKKTIEALSPELKYICLQSTGYNVVDMNAANEKGICVCNIPAYSTNAVAQEVFAFILHFANQTDLHSDSVHAGDWCACPDFCYWKAPLFELDGKTIGIIGFGSIGQKVAHIAESFGMNVLFNSRSKKDTSDFKTAKQVALDYLACGIDPEKSTIFIQSMVPELTELSFYYMNLVTVSRVQRNPTVKSEIKMRNFEASIPVGFFCYPISQAADITAFRATEVPVGEDQLPMLEQCKEIVHKFNSVYGETLTDPEIVLPSNKACLRLPGIDGKAKMSKSLGNCIYLSDEADEVKKKVMSMYTDPNHIRVEDPGQIEGNSVFTYLDAFCRPEHFEQFLPDYKNLDELKEHYSRAGLGDVKVKKFLNNVLQSELTPIRERRKMWESRIPDVLDILKAGSEAAQKKAAATLHDVRSAMKINYFDADGLENDYK